MTPVGLISNPGSGHNRDQFDLIRARIERTPDIHHVITDSIAQIPAALSQLASLDIGVLAINGGDGTCSAILGEMLESNIFENLPLIAILPGGTANMNAGDIGVSGSLAKATDRFCNWCENGQSADIERASRSLLRVQIAADPIPRYGMFLGAGAVIQGTDYAHKEIHSRGLRDDFSLALGVLRTIWGLSRNDPAFRVNTPIEMAIDSGGTQHHNMLILAMSTLHRLAFGMRPFWGKGEGNMRITVIEHDCSRFVRTFISILRGKPSANAVTTEGFYSYNAQSLSVDMEGKLNLDGEILEASGPVEISASPVFEFLKL
ncbi:MAG: diacylglycerol kinase family protein [Halioglobus sp.]